MQIPENIQILISKYLDGSATKAERQAVNDWYRSFSDSEIEIISDQPLQLHELEQRIKSRLQQTIQNKDSGSKRRVSTWWLRSAAAVILIIAAAAVYFSSNNKNEVVALQQVTPNTQVIVPGGNKAILTLADGSTIILDSAANGIVSNEGNVKVTKLANGLLVYTINGKQVTENDAAFFNTITTPRGGQYKITLADGTKVWLNAASSIRFPIVFTGNERLVTITGEVYLEVAKNASMPFKVNAGLSQIEVLGTHFNVNTYDDELNAKTTVLEGSVKVSASLENKETQEKILKYGQQAVVNKNGQVSVLKNVDLQETIAWINGRFQFKSADLKTILRQISRWYDADIQYNGKVDLHFTGQIPRNEDVKKVFETLALTGEVNFKIDGKIIFVSAK